MRTVLGVIIALSLTACGKPAENADDASALVGVSSQLPLLTKADAAAAPHLRKGLWRAVDDDCAVDDTKPSGAWPTCAVAIVVREGEMLTRYGASDVVRENVILLAGYPMTMQLRYRSETGLESPSYYGLRPVLVDQEIVEYRRWEATCRTGLAGGDSASEGDAAAQLTPPGVLKGFEGDNARLCYTNSRDLLRAAVIASETVTPTRRYRWVRAAEQ